MNSLQIQDYSSQQKFVHLKVRSDYSLLKSTIKPKKIAELAWQNGMKAVGICDENNLFGALEFSNYCISKGVQPIISAEFEFNFSFTKNFSEFLNEDYCQSFSPSDLFEKQIEAKLMFVVKNETGYKNLLEIQKEAARFIQIEKDFSPFWGLIRAFSDGLICIISFADGFIKKFLEEESGHFLKKPEKKEDFDLFFEYAKNQKEINFILSRLNEVFGGEREDLYFEISRHGYDFEKTLEPLTLIFSSIYDLPVVACCDVMFASEKNHATHDALVCIKEGTYLSVLERKRFEKSHYFLSSEEMEELFEDLPFALENTVLLSKRLSFCPQNRKPSLPKFGDDEETDLRKLSREGLKQKFLKGLIPEEEEEVYQERLEFELSTICRMGFAGYFLIVADFILWAKNQNIYVGPGRGSAAGSLVAWVTGITDVDPIVFGLLFERFLNPERISMPDIDIDFCPKGRDLVIDYIKRKYGEENVAHIIAFGGMQARGVMRDVGRVLGLPYSKVDGICKLIPFNPANPITLEEAIALDPVLRAQAEEDESIKNLLDISLELEGILRNQSTHAAGIVISDRPLKTLIPVWFDSENGSLITGFHMKPLEASGLVKFDFLGLSTLTLIQDTMDLIEKRKGFKIQTEELSLDDGPTYEMLSSGKAIGVFQLESGIMRDGLKKIKPERIEDVIALVSLNRPGPMENVPEYIARKFGFKEVDYLHPSLEKLLAETFGIIVYQEQVMEIAKILAGYSLAEADLLRRAMGKKIKEEMDKQKEFFINGAMKNGIEPSKADYIFELVAKFAGYGFNKSHATAYAIISYYTAWLKTHYKLEFFSALFNLEIQNTDKLGILKADASAHDVRLLGPCVLRSEVYFSVQNDDESGAELIRYGLYAIKNVGEFVSSSIFESRQKEGDFQNVFEFLKRFNNKVLNKKSLESLIKSGALDLLIFRTNSSLGLSLNRASLLASVMNLIDFINQNHESSNQLSLFSSFASEENDNVFERPDIQILKELSEPELALNEFEAIGFYLEKNPINSYSSFLKKNNVVSCADSSFLGAGQSIYMAGAISGIHIRSSKRGKFANLTIVDESGLSELFIYDGKMIEENAGLLKAGNLIFIYVKGMGEKNAGENSSSSVRLIVQTLSDLKKVAISSKSVFELEFNDEFIENFERDENFVDEFQKILGESIEIPESTDDNNEKKKEMENFPNFNTYFIFKIFSQNKFGSLIEIKPKLIFRDFDDFSLLKQNLLSKIKGFIDLKKVF